jgi:transcriptional regulator with XRE-family HTH domain
MAESRLTPYVELATLLDMLPSLLLEARRARGLTQRATAAEIGISHAAVARAETGHGDMSLANAVLVFRWLDQTGDRHHPALPSEP